MKLASRLFSVVGLFVIGVVCCWGHASPAQEKAKKTDGPGVVGGGGTTVVGAAPPKWEYKIVELNPNSGKNSTQIEQDMNQLGEAGWELAGTSNGVSGAQGLPTITYVRLFFKRSKK